MRLADEKRERRFDALFESYLADMVAYCGWRARSAADAEDAVAEVFLAAWRRLDEVPGGQEARLWLYGTARRVMANQARTSRRKALLHVRLQSFPSPEGAFDGDMEAVPPSPLTEAVREALAALGPADRETLLLSEWEGLSPTQIAEVMQCPAVTARGRLFRARRRFRAALEERGVRATEQGTATRSVSVSPSGRSVDATGAALSR